METKSPLFQIPIPSTDVGGAIGFEHDGSAARLSFQFRQDGVHQVSVIEFRRVRAFRHRAEVHCSAWHIEDAYDTLVEVAPSTWARDVLADTPEHWKHEWPLRHYLIYLDSAGAYEVLADSWEARTEML